MNFLIQNRKNSIDSLNAKFGNFEDAIRDLFQVKVKFVKYLFQSSLIMVGNNVFCSLYLNVF